MEMTRMERFGNSKAQFMTLILLILFILMLSILMVFVVEEVNYQNIAQNIALSSTSINYGKILSPELTTLLYASSERALSALSALQLDPHVRGSTFVSNLPLFMEGLIYNGSVAGLSGTSAQSQFLSSQMGNMTLIKYDKALAALVNSSFRVTSVNQTGLMVSQLSGSSLAVSVTYNIVLNATGSIYSYHIPVNITVPLNGTQDLLYASQGQLRTMEFGSLAPATPMFGYALSGNSTGMTYGTVFLVPSGITCSSGSLPLSNYLPSQFSTAPTNKSIILVTPDATKITNSTCDIAGWFGGLMTYNVINAPNIPYLIYGSGTGYLNYFTTGQKILLYGPLLAAMNETALRSGVMNGEYFTSPFASSYSHHAAGYLSNSSPYGMFTFSNVNRQAANFNGQGSNISGSGTYAFPISNTQWIRPVNYGTSGFQVITEFDGAGSLGGAYQFALSSTGHVILWNGNTNLVSNLIAPIDSWSFVGYTLNSTYVTIYVNGQSQKIASATTPTTSADTYWVVGTQGGYTTRYFNGSMSNVQVYNRTLTNVQMQSLYHEGISGIPLSSSNLIGWWPLNGNANDYSGNGSNVIPKSITYSLLQNYTGDSVFGIQTSNTMAFSIPGIMSCTNSQYCANTMLPRLTLDSFPLEAGGQGANVAQILGTTATTSYSSNARITATVPQIAGTNTIYTAAMWVYVPSSSPSNMPFFGLGSFQALEFFRSGVGTVSNQIGLHRCSSADTWESGIPVMSLNRWHFVAISVNPPNYYFQLDNYSSNVTNSYTYTNNALVVIGTQTAQCDGSIFPGNITNVQLYNTSLSETTLHKLFEEGMTGKPVQTQNLVGWWPLNGNANDYSGNNNNGVAYNVTYPFASGSVQSSVGSTYSEAQNEQQAIGFP